MKVLCYLGFDVRNAFDGEVGHVGSPYIGRSIYGYLETGIQTPMAQGRSTQIIAMIKWIRTSRLSITLSVQAFYIAEIKFGNMDANDKAGVLMFPELKRVLARAGSVPTPPPSRQPRSKWLVSLVNSLTNATSKRWRLWEIELRFALNSTQAQRAVWYGPVGGHGSDREFVVDNLLVRIHFIVEMI